MRFISTLFFLSLSLVKKPNFLQKHDIYNFWVDQHEEQFGYVDTTGNIIQFDKGFQNRTVLYENVPHVNHFVKKGNTTVVNYFHKHYEKTHLVTPVLEKNFVWKDTTLSEYVHNNQYYRCNHFGSLYVYDILNDTMQFLELHGKSRRNYFQKQIWMNDGVSVSINIENKLSIQELRNKKMEEVFSLCLSEPAVVRKMKIDNQGDNSYILLHFDNNVIYLLTIKKISLIEKYQMVGSHKVVERADTIDSEIKYPLLITSSPNELNIYQIKSNVFMEKMLTKELPQFPYYTSILFHRNWILFNGQSRVLYFIYLIYT